MRVQDQFGYPVTTDAAAAIAHWDETVLAFLAHAASTPVHLHAALDADPNLAVAHAAKGYFMLLLGRRELVETARAAHCAAARALGRLTARERAMVEGLALYLGGNLRGAADCLDAALDAHPGDALLVKLVHGVRFVLGDLAGMRSSIERARGAFGPEHHCKAYIEGCMAFALEESGNYRQAEQVGRDAIAYRTKPGYGDAWGLHAVAHVFDMTNRATEGVAWIRKQPGVWSHCNNFAYHVWWHLALFHLERGEHAETLRLYDEEIRAERTDDYRDISNAASLLMRLQLEGVDVGHRWEELAALSAGRTDDGCVVFADLHYMLALGAENDTAAAGRLAARLRMSAERALGCMDHVAAHAGASAGEGLAAFAAGDYARAYGGLAAARPHMQEVGGSHAQRDVFERVTIEAALRAGLLADARRVIQSRTAQRGALDHYAATRLQRIHELELGADAARVAAE